MGIRNSKELGENLFRIATRLLENKNLCKYLKYTNDNPLNNPDIEDPINTILHKNIKIVPMVSVEEFNTESTIVLVYDEAIVNEDNTEFNDVELDVLVYVPLREWQINSLNLRPFLIMSEIEKSLEGKRVEGLGLLKYIGFNLHLLDDNLSCYRMRFTFDVFH